MVGRLAIYVSSTSAFARFDCRCQPQWRPVMQSVNQLFREDGIPCHRKEGRDLAPDRSSTKLHWSLPGEESETIRNAVERVPRSLPKTAVKVQQIIVDGFVKHSVPHSSQGLPQERSNWIVEVAIAGDGMGEHGLPERRRFPRRDRGDSTRSLTEY